MIRLVILRTRLRLIHLLLSKAKKAKKKEMKTKCTTTVNFQTVKCLKKVKWA